MESFFLSETCKYLYLVRVVRFARGVCGPAVGWPRTSQAPPRFLSSVWGARSGKQMQGCRLCEVRARSVKDPCWCGGREASLMPRAVSVGLTALGVCDLGHTHVLVCVERQDVCIWREPQGSQSLRDRSQCSL